MADSTAQPVDQARNDFRRTPNVLLICAIYILVCFGAACLVDSRMSFPPVPDISARYKYFAEKRNEFDTVFIGSSRFRNEVVPEVFDAATAAGGVQTHSFNLGYSGMWPPESFYYLRQVLALHPGKLRWVVIELLDYRFSAADHQPSTMRAVYWHDWQHTVMAWRLVVESPLAAMEKGQQFARHGWLFLQRLTHPGWAADALANRYFPNRKKLDMSWMQRAGFDPEPKSEWTGLARAEYAQKVEAFEQAGPREVRPGLAAAVRAVIEEVHAAGAEPIFVLTPSVIPEENLAGGLPKGMTILAYNDPLKFPRLYLPEMHYDAGHLTEEGARAFTSLLARGFVEAVQKR